MLLKLASRQKRGLFHILSFLGLFLYGTSLQAQVDTETQAKQLFSAQKFDEALPLFSELIRLYPNDPDLNYYYGACLFENGEFTEPTRQALIRATGTQKSVWYLAQYYHAQSDWENAANSYFEFQNTASPKDFKSVPFADMLDWCQQKINPFQAATESSPVPETATGVLVVPSVVLSVPDSSSTPVELQTVNPAVINNEEPDKMISEDNLIMFPVNAQISYLLLSQFKSDEARQNYLKSKELETSLNQQETLLKKLRERYEQLDEWSKTQLVDSILKLEQETYLLNRQMSEAAQSANSTEASYWSKAQFPEISALQAQNREIKKQLAYAEQKKAEEEAKHLEEMLIIEATDTAAIDSLMPQTQLEATILYKIQLGAYRSNPPAYTQALFKKLSVLRRIDQYTDEKGVTVYTVGELKKYAEAQQMLKQIKQEGVNSAIIAAYKDSVRIPVEEAQKLTEQ